MTPPVWLPGAGFLTEDGRYYGEARVRAALLLISDWWAALTEPERQLMSQIGHLAAIDREIDAAVFGGRR